jgi:dihydroorotase
LGNKLFLYNAKIWNNDGIREGHLFIDERSGKIERIFWKKPTNPAQYGIRINIENKLVIPSLVDIHCHLRGFNESHKETLETGAKAAAAGGYTHIFDMPNKDPPITTEEKISKLKENSRMINQVEIIPYLLLNERTKEPFVFEYPFLKAYLGLTTGEYLTSLSEIERFLMNSTSFLSVHCEDNDLINTNKLKMTDDVKYHCEIRSPQTELNSIRSLIQTKKKIQKNNLSLHLAHVTLTKAVNMLKTEGISFEVTPHHLLLNKDDYTRLGVWAKMNPPLRTKTEQQNLLSAFLNGEISIIATDHAPHTKEEKEQFHLSGVPGLETALPTILNRLQPLDITKLKIIIDTFAVNPRKLMKFQSKGIVTPGEIANLTVIDLELTKTVSGEELFTKCKWSPWEGEKLQGWPVLTIHRGKITHNCLHEV